MSTGPDSADLASAILSGDRRALARAITLVESSRPQDRARARALIAHLARAGAKAGRDAMRIALSGTPGVGKSTFVEAFGMMLVQAGHKVAVLAVDPSSARSGGSILGDKTRMPRLARAPEAYIRPSPSQAALGGVARRTREAIALVEAAGFDIVLVETVGVGQSETMVAEMTDIFVLLMAPAGGDELQGVKRGIMEMADIVLVNKADGDLRPSALRTVADYSGALRLMRRRPGDPDGFPCVMPVSAVQGDGLVQAWQRMQALDRHRRDSGHLARQRTLQALTWYGREVQAGLIERARALPELAAEWARQQALISTGTQTPEAAAEAVLAVFAQSTTAAENPLTPAAPAPKETP